MNPRSGNGNSTLGLARYIGRVISYPDSVRYLYSLGNELKTVKLGLERISALLEALGHPERDPRFVHVAGTNGKGSVCAMIDSALRAAGGRTGLYTSPHLVEPTERIQIDGQPVTNEQFASAFEQVHAAAAHMDSPPTYFETMTAMAFLLFRELCVERVVLETGLGGRLDATNVVAPELCVITPIDFDHETWLGSSIEGIAREKAGILKPGAPAVFSGQRPEAAEVLESRARELGIDFHLAGGRSIGDLAMHARGCRFRIGEARVNCPLAGVHQVDNAVTAVTALERLDVPVASIELGIARTVWPARLQLVSENPEMIVDGAHNPAGIRALAAYIERFYSGRRIWIVYGAMRDKSLGEIAGILSGVADEMVLTAPKGPRAARPEALRELFDHPRVRLAPHLSQALEIAAEAGREDVVFVTGSLFLAGEFLATRPAGIAESPTSGTSTRT